MPQLRSGGSGHQERGSEPVHPVVPEHAAAVVPDRGTTAVNERFRKPSDLLHLALVVPDLKTYRALRESCWVIKPNDWETEVKVHVLLESDRSKQELKFAFALTELGLTDAKAAKLHWPENIELGWNDDTPPDD